MNLTRSKPVDAQTEMLSIQLFMMSILFLVVSPGVIVAKLLCKATGRCVKGKLEDSTMIFAAVRLVEHLLD